MTYNNIATQWKDAELYKEVYREEKDYGITGAGVTNILSKYIKDFRVNKIFDYGCGQSFALIKALKEKFPSHDIRGYDPAIIDPDEIASNVITDEPFDFIISTDCLEHLWEDEIDFCLDIFRRKSPTYIFLTISTRAAGQILPDGTNAHKCVKSAEWWMEVIKRNMSDYSVVIDDFYPERHKLTVLLYKPTNIVRDIMDGVRSSSSLPFKKDIYSIFTQELGEDQICLEFGVHKGSSINSMAKLKPDNLFYGFDSFLGLPERWYKKDKYRNKGYLYISPTELNSLNFEDNVKIKSGWFEKTIPEFINGISAKRKSQIKLIHMDCCIYSSCKTVFDLLGDIIVANKCTILFSEFYNYKGHEINDILAFSQFIEDRKLQYKVVARHEIESKSCSIIQIC